MDEIFGASGNKYVAMDTTPRSFVESIHQADEVDNVNNPVHYKIGGIETIDFIEAKQLNYRLGNVVKYITRANHKGHRLEDLQKAHWYLCREIAKHKD